MKPNDQKITREFCKGRTLIFYPRTEEEAGFIQRRLFELGCVWCNDRAVVQNVKDCVSHGIFLDAGKIYYDGGNTAAGRNALLCTSAQFDQGAAPELTPEEQKSLREEFNALAALVKDMAKKVDALYDEVMPKKLDKPTLKGPDQAS